MMIATLYLLRPFLAHFLPFFPVFSLFPRLGPKIQETGTKTLKNGP